MLRPTYQCAWIRCALGAAILCALAALSGCGVAANNSSSRLSAPAYSLGATISGLNSSGLVLMVHTRSPHWQQPLYPVPHNVFPLVSEQQATAVDPHGGTTTQLLAVSLPSGTEYSVSVGAQPAGETCSVAGGAGTITSANVANLVVTCSDQAYLLGGFVRGLNGSGLVLANGSNAVSAGAGATSFTLPMPVAYTSSYQVKVQNQPSGEACAVTNGSGTMPASAVTTVSVTCTDQPFTLGGTISGLGSNTGLVLANGADTLNVAPGTTRFEMPTAVVFGSSYALVVQSAPAGLTCTASNASGTMPASNLSTVVIACSDQSYTVGGSISGLISSGLVLANGSDAINVPSGAASFQMDQPVAYTSAYDVLVQSQPTGLTCTVGNSSATMPASNVSNVSVTCSANTYTVGGTISGLNASGLVLLDNGGDATTINANAAQFTMNSGIAYGALYEVTVQSQPAELVCTVSDGSGTMAAGDVSSISISCESNFTLLYSLQGGSSDAADPYHCLIQASDGDFFGTTLTGGAHNGGAIFQITPSGAESLFYSFASMPWACLTEASSGDFYGTTASGGTNGRGTVFTITPSGTESVLYSFPAGGSQPYTGLIQGSDGNFYGTTGANGTSDDGTVFKITPSGSETVLHAFPKSSNGDGQTPYAGLIQGSDGNFYGTTYNGGSNGLGTVFKVTPSGTETVLYSFAGGSDGEHPYAGVIQGSDGNFYGTTYQGGASGVGTVFSITPSGTETVLYSFAGGSSDGANPEAGLTQGSDGNFYGATYLGGANGDGAVFRITPSGTETIMHSFAGSDGTGPWANLVQGNDGNLYGSTYAGGTKGDGTVFKITL